VPDIYYGATLQMMIDTLTILFTGSERYYQIFFQRALPPPTPPSAWFAGCMRL